MKQIKNALKYYVISERFLIFSKKNSGGANGLGRAISFRLGQEGCDVIIIDINEKEALRTAVEIHEQSGVKTKSYKVDVSSFEAFQELKQNISNDFNGRTIDILINNAGILSSISLTEGHYTQIQKQIDVNLASHFWVRQNSMLI